MRRHVAREAATLATSVTFGVGVALAPLPVQVAVLVGMLVSSSALLVVSLWRFGNRPGEPTPPAAEDRSGPTPSRR